MNIPILPCQMKPAPKPASPSAAFYKCWLEKNESRHQVAALMGILEDAVDHGERIDVQYNRDAERYPVDGYWHYKPSPTETIVIQIRRKDGR